MTDLVTLKERLRDLDSGHDTEEVHAYRDALAAIEALERERDALNQAWRWASYIFDEKHNLSPLDQVAYESLRDEVDNAALTTPRKDER